MCTKKILSQSKSQRTYQVTWGGRGKVRIPFQLGKWGGRQKWESLLYRPLAPKFLPLPRF